MTDFANMALPIPGNKEIWDVHDSTKMKSFMTCPRQYLYEYILGWRPEKTNIHFVFGTSIHLAIEYLLNYQEDKHPDNLGEALPRAVEIFLEEYRKSYTKEEDEDNRPKSPVEAVALLRSYITKYSKTDDFRLLASEVSGCTDIGEGMRLWYKLDTIIEYMSGPYEGLWSMDHKTTKQNSNPWRECFQNDIQPATYIHALTCSFPDKDVKGLMVNGLVTRKTSPELIRIVVQYTEARLQQWLLEMQYEFLKLTFEYEQLAASSEMDEILMAFPRRTTSCNKFGLCTFHGLCTSELYLNPLRHIERPPPGYHTFYWDPRPPEEQDSEPDPTPEELAEAEAKLMDLF